MQALRQLGELAFVFRDYLRGPLRICSEDVRLEGWPTQDDSTLKLYSRLLMLRKRHQLGTGEVRWMETGSPTTLAFRNGDVTVMTNFGKEAIPTPPGSKRLVSSTPGRAGIVPQDATVWLTNS